MLDLCRIVMDQMTSVVLVLHMTIKLGHFLFPNEALRNLFGQNLFFKKLILLVSKAPLNQKTN